MKIIENCTPLTTKEMLNTNGGSLGQWYQGIGEWMGKTAKEMKRANDKYEANRSKLCPGMSRKDC
ncbi:hypothetical protein [Priestia taiwanensis]|uniref:Uncharacterized protein n=1 Tax=Priestia taiwanensis TaxID=1347902 RepID=A0A917ET02_9BACI|nr:hypothetical protein [Priestia taiwanensis]MBM7365300.1 hypothetical protein [Priestia taiwanensis]GGE85994.1 hypothetical protein GCM10007140_39220 [Priestia taiwanensis]